ncbi:monovalent cation/H+ antiporter complex subunit F [Litorilinea aerophila]|uniref:PH regulation protein F n=1 Tax=Litorilinea aerophila TaxID=1204385 RepID=A0A540VMJ8_9CHLR|nr:monovalent cation/H+ antiporter complex subunit F [Litorilinea aerophila]MCC9075045.1 monovalent cation/H+ antiporter complex subunit F [Litorilinea aerophila]GIV79831.1 MAG: cation transporter [Litorilinea sp.]
MNIFETGLTILTAILSISLVLCFIRLYLGPNLPNRTVAFDIIAIHAVGILALIALRGEAAVLLDVAIVTAALGFLGTVMLARYLEQANVTEWEPERTERHISEKRG